MTDSSSHAEVWKMQMNHLTVQVHKLYFCLTVFPLARNVLSRLLVQSIQQAMARQSHQKCTPDFYDKCNKVLAGGATFCIVVWTYTATQIGIKWNLSPVGRVTSKEWRDQ
ncbi:cytochrome c oxidase subunit 7B, mitochondrial-like [Ochotona princeps]|uniref:cytochrome c oxidase subunit 7B, mitochondrial-like n=1 Tax=Ochotona princeps TaxID=9978 RepID=UPI002714B90D|nr:cytochrome c oxidase subunit 7B, mitochondrial-like [Ochotona princeps]